MKSSFFSFLLFYITIFHTAAVAAVCETTGSSCAEPGPQAPIGCTTPSIYSVPDDCGCRHWHCAELPSTIDQVQCPTDWTSYRNRAGAAFCTKVINTEVTWRRASLLCDGEGNSNLLNSRRLELFTEGDSVLLESISDDIERATNQLPHWSGLHMILDKLYWDDTTPFPDRDLTAESQSIVQFNSAQWIEFQTGRSCVTYKSQLAAGVSNRVTLQPEYCSGGFPFICAKELPTSTNSFYKARDNLLCGGQEGWYGSENSGLCYKYFTDLVSFEEAQQVCQRNKAALADPRTAIKQRFLIGMLDGLPDSIAPLTVYVGMQQLTNQQVQFGTDDIIAVNQLSDFAILSQPTATGKCGVLNNPFFAEQRLDSGTVQFGDCAGQRPFICTRGFDSQIVSEFSSWNVTVVRNGYLLTCEMAGLENVPGVVIWKKDHQYFPKQNNSQTLSLTSQEYKYLIDDNTDRAIGHGELAGLYACEFWQTFPTGQYKSSDLAVTFNDSTSLRMSTVLNGTNWSAELEAFNYRVSHRDELSPEVQAVYNLLLSMVQVTLTPFSQASLEYGINILFLRRSSNNKVEVDYRITVTGDEVAGSQSTNATSSDGGLLESIQRTLLASDLSSDAAQNQSIDGQFTCLKKTLTHPQTLANLTLPRTPDGFRVMISGGCGGRMITMLTAKCQYNKDLRLSRWSSIAFTNCSTSCQGMTITHSLTRESFQLLSAQNGVTQTFTGVCGHQEQTMFSATCTDNSWNVVEHQCVLMCPAGQLHHPQWSEPLPENEIAMNSTYQVDMLCDSTNKTILTASCEPNDQGTNGVWKNINMETCEVKCNARRIVHSAGTIWNLSETPLGQKVELTGQCNGVTTNIGAAACIGDVANGAAWNISLISCSVTCPPQTFIHPDTLASIALSMGEVNETVVVDLSCSGQVLPVEAECRGSLALGANWRLKNMPSCKPVCPQHEWFDQITNHTYSIPETDYLSQSEVEGSCGGIDMTLMVATCTGDIINGVSWEYEIFNCTPSCEASVLLHPDTMANLTLPITRHGQLVTLTGRCSGESNVPLMTGRCGGDVTENPEWVDLQFTLCTGYCSSKVIDLLDTDRHSYVLARGEIGETVTVNGTCALLPFMAATAQCLGNAADGGEWSYTINECSTDTSCPRQHFVHPDTKAKLIVESSLTGATVSVRGECHGVEVILLNVTCQAVAGNRGVWTEKSYSPCKTNLTDQLTNLLDNFKDNPLELMSLTASISKDLDNSTDEAIHLLTNIVEFVASPNTSKSVEDEGTFFFDIIDNMLNVELNTEEKPDSTEDEKGSTGNRLAKSVEDFLDSANSNTSQISINKSNLLIEVIDTSFLDDEEDIALATGSLNLSLAHNVVNGSKLNFVKYSRTAMFSTAERLLGDTVFSASVSHRTVEDSTNAITYVMEITPNDTLLGKAVCGYWNFSTSAWSTEGCSKTKGNNSVKCTCNHLTNFAIIMDTAGQDRYIADEHHLALTIITMTGLGISVVALSLHLISFLFIEKLRRNQFQKVLANLAFAILASNLVFLAGIDKVTNPTACIAMAALLHYFILASFCWMFVEAFMQYRRFVKVLGTHVTHVLVKAGLPAWIIPTVPVAIVFIVDPQLYRGGAKFCWMKREALYYSFLFPIGAIILANIVLFTLILRGLTCARPSQLRTNKSENHRRMMYFKAGLAIFTLLGMTWVFGFFAVSSARLAFQYLFCITNAFQGLVIFLLHNVRDPKVMAWWRSVLHLKPLPAFGTSRGTSASTYLSKKTDYSRSSSGDDWNTERQRAFKIKPAEKNENKFNLPSSAETPVKKTTLKRQQLEQSKVMHSSTESEESGTTQSSGVTEQSDL